jgi:Gpi18-like mannosyltransferase
MIILFFVGKLSNLLHITQGSIPYIGLIKSPAMISDIIIAILLYIYAKQNKAGSAILATLWILLDFGIAINSVFWGQIDSVWVLMIVASIILLTKDKKIPAVFLFVLAILTKTQSFVFAPIYLAYFLTEKKPKTWVLSVAIALITIFLVAIPFTKNFDFTWLYEKYRYAMNLYKYRTMNAFNFYYMLGWNYKSSEGAIFSIISILVAGTLSIYSMLTILLKKNNNNIFYTAFLLMFGIFVLMPQMHERYIFPALVFLYFAFVAFPITLRKKVLPLLITISITTYANCHYALVFNEGPIPNNFLTYGLSLINVIAFIYSIVFSIKLWKTQPSKN